MNALQRFISKFVPPTPAPACEHEQELQTLRAECDQAQARYEDLDHRHDELLHEHVKLVLTVCQAHQTAEPNTTPVVLLQREREQHTSMLSELAGRLEEGNARVADLEQRMRERGIPLSDDEQSDLGVQVNAEAGESPIAEDEVIYDKVLRLAFGLVGVFFDEGRHHWLLQRGPERVKVPIKDRAFLDRITRGEQSFRAGDALLVEVHAITRRASTPDRKVYVEYISVDKVVSLVHADENLALDLDGEEKVADALTH